MSDQRPNRRTYSTVRDRRRKAMERRATWLAERIAEHYGDPSRDRGELSAIRWLLDVEVLWTEAAGLVRDLDALAGPGPLTITTENVDEVMSLIVRVLGLLRRRPRYDDPGRS